MKSWLFIGAKVVCTDASPHERSTAAPALTQGGVYTVEGVHRGAIAISLVELPNPPGHFQKDGIWQFRVSRFRPVSTINTDATVAALNQMMRDHVNHASGGLGIGKVRA